MISGSKCRHLNSAGRGLFMECAAEYQTRSLSFCNTTIYTACRDRGPCRNGGDHGTFAGPQRNRAGELRSQCIELDAWSVYASTKRPLWYCGRYVVACRNRSGLNGAILGAISARDHAEKVELLPCAAASNGESRFDLKSEGEQQ